MSTAGPIVLTAILAALRVPAPPQLPRVPDAPRKNGAVSQASREHLFGVGVGFSKAGTLAGVTVDLVLRDSPAARADLRPGCVVVEINGEPTAGRTGEECARRIRDAFGPVRIRFLDLGGNARNAILTKEWLTVPES